MMLEEAVIKTVAQISLEDVDELDSEIVYTLALENLLSMSRDFGTAKNVAGRITSGFEYFGREMFMSGTMIVEANHLLESPLFKHWVPTS